MARNLKLDNFRGILIFLVVFSHLLFSYTYYNSNEVMLVVKFIYSFHMSLFFIISGLLSKKVNNKNLFKLLLLFFMMDLSFIIFDFVKYGNFDLFSIKYSSWYLLYLFSYRMLVNSKLFKKFINKYEKILLILSFGIMILSGFIDSCVGRLFYFFYFFLFGYVLNLDKIKLAFYKGIRGIVICLLFSFLIVSIIPFNLNFFMGLSYVNNIEWLFRLLFGIINTCLFVFCYSLISDKNIKFLSRIGECSLSIYFFHRIFTLILTDLFIINKYFIFIVVFFTIAICLFFSSNFIINVFNKCLNKLWIFFTKYKSGFIFCLVIVYLCCFCFYCRDDISNYFKDVTVVSYDEMDTIDDSFSIGFVGDLILLEDQITNSYSDVGGYNFDGIFEYTKDYFYSVDYMIGVLEGPVDDLEDYSYGNFDDGKELRLNYPSSFLDSIKNSGIDLVTTANNHLLDRGVDSVLRTIDNLNEKSLDFVGSYANNDDNKRKIVEIDGMRIGILAYTYGINYQNEEDLFSKYGYITNYLCDSNSEYFFDVKNKVVKDFDYLKSKDVDLIVVLPHYGTQFSTEVDKYQKLWNDIFVSNGADIILGSHSHSVQPVMYVGDTLIVNSPGNFVNSYVEYDGDVSMIVKVYVDKDSKKVVASGIVPLLAVKENNRYISMPIYRAIKDKKISSLFSNYLDRFRYANDLVTRVSMGYEVDDIEEEYLYFRDGYKKNNKYVFELSGEDKNSVMYNLIDDSNSVCFVGDSITEGTKNSYHPWYETLMEVFEGREVYNFSKGGYTSFDIIDNYLGELRNSTCDLVVINIGTNDIRYNMTSSSVYMDNIKKILSSIDDRKVVLLSPFRTTDNDRYLKDNRSEKKRLYDDYDSKLEEFANRNDYIYYINVNSYINKALLEVGENVYMDDGVHPNGGVGVDLYSYATMRN